MIKLVAALTMLIDHIGFVLFPDIYVFRVIGRLSMPLFAYCIARGFWYSNKHGTVKKYIRNMALLSLASQLPYYLMVGNGLNICFTWLSSLLLLTIIDSNKGKPVSRIICFVIVYGFIALLIELGYFPVDYGICGVTTPLLFYVLIYFNKENPINYTLAILIGWALFVVTTGTQSSLIQIMSIFSALMLTVGKKCDKKLKLPKWVFYSFYPAHIMVLLCIRYLIV